MVSWQVLSWSRPHVAANREDERGAVPPTIVLGVVGRIVAYTCIGGSIFLLSFATLYVFNFSLAQATAQQAATVQAAAVDLSLCLLVDLLVLFPSCLFFAKVVFPLVASRLLLPTHDARRILLDRHGQRRRCAQRSDKGHGSHELAYFVVERLRSALGRARIRIKHRNAGWEQHKDEASGHHYFFHAQSRRATWTMAGIKKHAGEIWRTSGAQQPAESAPKAPAPHEGWEQHKDEASGHHYFFHAQSRRTTWTMAGIKKHVGEMWGTSAAQQPFGVRNSTAPAPQKGVAPEPIIEESGSGRFGDAPFGYEQDSEFQARESDWGVFADGRVSTAVTVQSNLIHSSPRGAAARASHNEVVAWSKRKPAR